MGKCIESLEVKEERGFRSLETKDPATATDRNEGEGISITQMSERLSEPVRIRHLKQDCFWTANVSRSTQCPHQNNSGTR